MGSHRYAGPRHARRAGARHAKPTAPSTLHRTAAAGGLAAALLTGESMFGVAGAVTPDTWAQLRQCEAGGNYAINTGNGYYGAYQFSAGTWHGLGYPGLPSDAAPAVQDAAAAQLYQARGWQPWPGCSAKLGLVDDRTADRGTQRAPLAPVVVPPAVAPPVVVPVTPAPPAVVAPVDTATPPPAPAPVAPVAPPAPVATQAPAPVAPGAWDGHYLTTRDAAQVRADVKDYQQLMVAAGYAIAIDGRYGPQSAAAATAFEKAHGLTVETPGIVGPQVWSALAH